MPDNVSESQPVPSATIPDISVKPSNDICPYVAQPKPAVLDSAAFVIAADPATLVPAARVELAVSPVVAAVVLPPIAVRVPNAVGAAKPAVEIVKDVATKKAEAKPAHFAPHSPQRRTLLP